MKTTLVYFSASGADAEGRLNPFLLQELPWLLEHFNRVCLCCHAGTAELTAPAPERVALSRPALSGVRAALQAPFTKAFWQELNRLRRNRRLTPINAAKLFLFTVRGLTLHFNAERLLRGEESAVLYSFWMSYDGFAAALCKRRHPAFRAVARGHAFDIDVERNPMNPYLMKRFTVDTLDGLYPISRSARGKLLQCVAVPENKLHVLTLGSAGDAAIAELPAPFYETGTLHVVSCSSLVPLKRIPLLIDALADWRGAPVGWTHIGGGELEEATRAYAKQRLSNLPNVRWEITGTLPASRVQALYAATPFDVFINVSQSEGTPVSIMEAMRAGLPIIAPDVGGIPDLVDKSVGRLLPPAFGKGEIVSALAWIAGLSQPEAEAMRAAARTRWNENCRSDVSLEKLFPETVKGADGA